MLIAKLWKGGYSHEMHDITVYEQLYKICVEIVPMNGWSAINCNCKIFLEFSANDELFRDYPQETHLKTDESLLCQTHCKGKAKEDYDVLTICKMASIWCELCW